jgi:hypothetical protein
MRFLQYACCQASWITFQLTSWLAANSQTADTPHRSPFGSPCGCEPLTLALQLARNAYPCELYRAHTVKPVRSPSSSPLGLQLTLGLLTSPSDHLSAHLVAVQTYTLELISINLFLIYAKNWLNNMGVRTGLLPQQGVQKWDLHSMGGGGQF